MLQLLREELVEQGLSAIGMEISILEQQLETIKKFNESGSRNKTIKYYRNFIEFVYQSFPKQKKTLEKFVDKGGYTVEHIGFILTLDTNDINHHKIYLEEKIKDLKLK